MDPLARHSGHGLETNPRRFIVNLSALTNGRTEVNSCEIKSNHFRNRTSFPVKSGVDEIFVEGVAQAIQECLGKLSETSEVVSLPSFFLEVPGLILASANVMSSEGADGTINIILFFKFVMGGVNRAFRPEIGFNAFVDDQNAQLSAWVLADISLPLLNFCTAAEIGALDGDAALALFIERLKERSTEIKFQVELLKRYVENNHREPFKQEVSSFPPPSAMPQQRLN